MYFFDDIIGPPFFTGPGILFDPYDGESDVSVTSNLQIINIQEVSADVVKHGRITEQQAFADHR